MVLRCRRLRCVATGGFLHHWKLGLSQYRFHRALRACGSSPYTSSGASALLTCCFPLQVSSPGRSVALRGINSRPPAPVELSSIRRNGARFLKPDISLPPLLNRSMQPPLTAPLNKRGTSRFGLARQFATSEAHFEPTPTASCPDFEQDG